MVSYIVWEILVEVILQVYNCTRKRGKSLLRSVDLVNRSSNVLWHRARAHTRTHAGTHTHAHTPIYTYWYIYIYIYIYIYMILATHEKYEMNAVTNPDDNEARQPDSEVSL